VSRPSVIVNDKEWERVKAYIDCAENKRKEEEPSFTITQQFDDEVEKSRNNPEWNSFLKKYELQKADIDILIFALAPIASPIIGWLYREHQTGDISGHPGIDLICELLSLKPSDVMTYRNRLGKQAPLIKHGLIVSEHSMPFAPLRPTQRARTQLLGLIPDGTEIPGATLVEPLPSLEEVICPRTLKEQLRQIASWPGHDSQLTRWGIAVEHGPVSLLAGPSGTGKTLAATALAREAGLSLYRVDLGLLVSKYIGETEKNLNAMFDRAAEMDCALLFDEADSLFGKRGQVKDAKDRYANMEVGHLLSRIERHRGMCLLTSNLREQIDPAFLRRIDVVLHFNLPTEEERRLLWKKYLGKMVCHTNQNKAKKNDEDKKDQTELLNKLAVGPRRTGAQIANACRYAGRLLAAELTRKDKTPPQDTLLNKIAASVHNELKKNSAEALRSSLGFLWEYLGEEQR
jgi:hypothetical protein